MRERADLLGGALLRESGEGAARASAGSPVVLRIAPPRTKLHLQTWDTTGLAQAGLQSGLQAAIGAPWPAAAGATAGTRTRVLCYGPVDWLLVADDAPTALLSQFEAVIRGSTFSVTDQSQGLAAIEVTGPLARELLSKACCLDFHPREFPAGACTRTRLAHVPVILDAAADGSGLACYVARSYLDYLVHWLTDAAVEFKDTSA